MSAFTHTFSFNLVKQIGEISERRIRGLEATGFDLIQHVNGAGALFMERTSGVQIGLTNK